jgi:hypothetical protein
VAGISASVNLEVKGGSKLERLIQNVSRLESIVNGINSSPIKLDINKANIALDAATDGLSEVRKSIREAQKDYNSYDRVVKNLEKDFISANKAISQLTVGSQKHIDALLKSLQLEGKLTEAKKKRGQLEERLQRQESKLPGAQRYLDETKQIQRLTVALTDLSDEYLKLGRYQTRTPVTGKVAASQGSGSIAQLRSQAEALSLVASNSEIASKQFNRFVLASQVANQKIFEGRQQQLKALAEGLALPQEQNARSRTAQRIGSQESLAGARSLIGTFVESYGAITKSRAALSDYISQASSLQSLVPFDSSEWNLLEGVINDVNGELQQLEQRFAGLRGQSSGLAKAIADGIAAPQGKSELLPQFSIQSAAKRAKYQENLGKKQEQQVDKLIDLEYELTKITLDQNEALELRNKIDKIYQDTSVGSIEAAKKQTVELKRQIREIKDRNKELSKGGAAGERPFATVLGGGAEVRARAAAEKARQITEKQDRLAGERFSSALERVSGAETRIQIAAEKGLINELQKKKLLLDLDEARLAIDEKRFTVARTIASEVDRERKSREGKIRPEIIKTGQISPVEGKKRVESAILSSQILERQLLSAQKEGLDVARELSAVRDAIANAGSDDYQNTKKTLNTLLDVNEIAAKRLRLEKLISEAQQPKSIRGTTIRGGEALGLDAPRRLRYTLASGAVIEQGLINLQRKGVDVTSELNSLQQALNNAKREDYVITQNNLDALTEQVGLAGRYVSLQKQILAGQGGSGRRSGEAGSGLEQAIESLGNARAAREKFLGGVSPAQGIDKIVREFNTGKPGKGAGANVVSALVSEARAGIPKAVGAGEALGEAVEDGLNKGLEIQSPSRVAIRAMENVIDTAVNTARAGKAAVRAAVEDLFAPKLGNVLKAPLSGSVAGGQDLIEKLANFAGRTSAKPSLFRQLAQLAGPEILSSNVLPQAMQRKAFEAGKILPETRLLPLDERRLLRGNAAAPGGGLEQAITDAAIRAVSKTGAFTGPLSSVIRSQGAISSSLFAPLSQGPVGLGGTGLFSIRPQAAIGAPGSAFPFQRYQMGGAQQFPVDGPISALGGLGTRSDASRAVSESIKKYRDAVNNFWEGEDSQFSAISNIVKSSAQLGGAKLARKLTESGRGAGLSSVTDVITGEKRLGASSAVANVSQRVSDSLLNSLEALGFTIADKFENAIDRVRNAIPSLFDSIGGMLPPGGFGGGGRAGAGGGAGDFGRRFEEAVAQGPEAVLGLKELAKPATASIKELEALSAVLKEFRAILDPTSEGFDRLEKQLRETAANLDRQLERRAPDADFLTRRFGSRGGRAVSEGLVGGAFPLLFGQGLGASVLGGLGGAAGGFAGGGLGFGLSLVGTALGTAFDTAVQGATELGAALTDTTATFDKVKERALFSSTQTEKFAGKLQEAGLVASAAVISQQEIISKIGRTGVQSLQQLAGSSDRLNRAWAEFSLQLQTALAGPMAGLLEWVSKVLNLANQESRSRAAVADIGAGLSGTKKQEFEQRRIDIEMRRGGIGASILRDLGIGNFLSDEEANNLRAQLVDEFKDFSVPVKLKPAADATQKTEQEIAILTKKLETTDIGKSLKDQVRQAAREQRDLDKQRADLVRSYEESISQIRQDVESRILQQRRENAETEIDLRARSAELELAKIKQANQEFRGLFADTTAGQVTDQLLNAVETVAQIQNDSATQRAKLELDIQNSVVDTEKYKIQIADQVSKLNLDTAQKVSDINEQVRQRNEEYDSTRFTLEKKIAQFKLSQERISFESKIKGFEVALKQSKALGETDAAQGIQNAIDVYRAQLDAIKKGEGEIKAISAPGKLKGVGAVGGSSVSTRGISEALQAGNNLKVALQDIAGLISQIDSETALSSITDQLDKQIISSSKLFEQYRQGGGVRSKDLAAEQVLVDAINQQIQSQIGKNDELVKRLQALLNLENGRPAIINKIRQAQDETFKSDKLIEFTQGNNELKLELEAQMNVFGRLTEVQKLQAEAQVRGIDLSDQHGQALLREAAAADELARKLEAAQQIRSTAESVRGALEQGIQDVFLGATGLGTMQERFDLQREISQFEKLRAKTEEGTDEYKRYTDQINQAKLKMNELSNTGVQVKDALSRMMQGIADAFAEMAAKIVADQILMFVWGSAIKALGLFASIGSAGATSLPGSMGQATNTGLDTGAGNITDMLGGLAAKGAYFNGGIASFGSGGMFTNSIVSSPTLFRFADGGIRKTGLMGEAGPEAIIPLSRGADGRLGVDATGFSDAISEARDALDEASDAMAQGDGTTGLELSGSASDGYGAMGLKSGEAQGKMSRATAMAISDSRGAVEMIKRITQENDAKAAAAAASASPETRELYKLLATKDSNTIREITNNQTGSADGTDQFAAGSQQQLAYGDAISAARGVLASEISGGEPDQMQQVGEAGAITNSREFIEKITDRISSPDSSKKAEASAFGDSRNAVGKSSGSQSAISTKETISALMQARDSRETSSAISQTREVLSSVSSMNKEKNMERVMESNVTAITKPLDIKYESQMINNVEYVTVDQYQRGLAEAAERGRALTLSSLKNSVKARRQIGI